MAPRARGTKTAKAPVPSIPPLQNCSITFATASIPSTELGGKNLATIKTEITGKGGVYVTKVDQATHLVATDAQYQKSLVKVNDAIQHGSVHIVSFDWLKESLDANSPVSEGQYLLHTASAPASTKSKKRTRDDTDKDDDNDDDDNSGKADNKKSKPSAKKVNGKAKQAKEAKAEIKKAAIVIPIDEHLPHQNFRVHIGDDSVIFDVTLNQSNSMANANKFYRMQLLESQPGKWHTWTRWGRVGESGQTKMLDAPNFDNALRDFEKKFRDKTGNAWNDRNGPIRSGKYVFIERNYDESDDEEAAGPSGSDKTKNVKSENEEEKPIIESKLPEPIQKLLKLIFNQEYFNNTFDDFDYDARKMPLGKLSKTTLMRGYDILKQLVTIISSNNASAYNQVSELSNQYLSVIPHVVSRSSRPPVLNNMNLIKKEIELLEALTDMQLANDVMKSAKQGSKDGNEEAHVLDRQYEGLGMQEMTPIAPDSTEFTEIKEYLVKSVGSTHGTHYKVQDVFRIQRKGESDRFSQSKYSGIKNTDRRLLWHGSRCTNFGGILSQGLRIAPPEAPVSGYMFGKGVYLADMSSKSANYCCSYNSGNTGLLLLCEAELGKPPLKLTQSDYDAGQKAANQGSISTWGVGMTAPTKWKDAGCIHPSLKGVSMPNVIKSAPGPTNENGAGLMYNEYIVYDVAQIKLRYLLRVEM